MKTLDRHKNLVSDLWLDRRDAHWQIDHRFAPGHIPPHDAAALHTFVDDGTFTLPIPDVVPIARQLDADLERLWIERPVDLAVQAKFGHRTSYRDFDATGRAIGWRVTDPHSHSEAARQLYLHPEIHRVASLILGQPAIAFQSVYFEYGSEQSLHRDPMFVPTTPASHFLAAWIALEDTSTENGPLLVVRGSHRVPWYEFQRDTITLPKERDDGGTADRAGWTAHRVEMLDRLGLEVEPAICRQGDVRFWHGGVIHGGGHVHDRDATRKSLLVHFSTAAQYGVRRARMRLRSGLDGADRWQTVEHATTARIVEGDRIGMDNPFRHPRCESPTHHQAT